MSKSKNTYGKGLLELNRRSFLVGMSAFSGGLALPGKAFASNGFADRQLVFASWGGVYQEVQKEIFCASFAADTGATVVQDGPVDAAKVRMMVEGGAPVWDVVDINETMMASGIQDGLFEDLSGHWGDNPPLDKRFMSSHGIGFASFSYNLAYDTSRFGEHEGPQTWADFFDLKKFPGKRMLLDHPFPSLEIALVADGVPIDQRYPLDIDRALEKLNTIKDEIIFWTTNSQSQQLIVDKVVTCGMMNNGRAYDAKMKGAPVALSWEENIQRLEYLVIPKGSKNLDVAIQFLRHSTKPELQAKLANRLAYAPVNADAFEFVEPDMAPWMSSAADNMARGFAGDMDYWRDHNNQLQERWAEWKLG